MDEKTYRINTSAILPLNCHDVDKLLSLGDGLCALLYLHILRHNGELIVNAAARDLNRSRDEISHAAVRLRDAGLLSAAPALPLPEEESPAFTVEDILTREREDRNFSALLQETQQKLGKTLSGTDLGSLFNIYDRLGLDAETIMLLINFCVEQQQTRYGENRLPTMRYIEKEAYRWAERGILSHEEAETYLKEYQRTRSAEGELCRVLQITGRHPSSTEQKYMDSWLSMGYSPEALELAYDRTIVKTGSLSWPYMDRIVRSWYDKQIFTREDIEKKEPVFSGKRKPNSGKNALPPRRGEDDSEALSRWIEQKKAKEQ